MTTRLQGSEPPNHTRRPILPRGLRLPLVLVIVWEAWFALSDSANSSLAAPSQVVSAFFSLWMQGAMLEATLQTIAATLIGLAIGGALGIVGGLFLCLSRNCDRLIAVSVEVSPAIPRVSRLPH